MLPVIGYSAPGGRQGRGGRIGTSLAEKGWLYASSSQFLKAADMDFSKLSVLETRHLAWLAAQKSGLQTLPSATEPNCREAAESAAAPIVAQVFAWPFHFSSS